MTVVRVASFNIRTSTGKDGCNRWLLRRRACLAAMRELDAGVIGLQEVRPGQLRGVRRGLPDAAFAGRGREADGRGEHAAVVVRDGWHVESSETRWLSPTPEVPGSRGWGAGHPRIVTLARLTREGAHLGVANTHFDHAGPGTAREHSAQLLARWLAAEPELPWVITGDLNAPPSARPVRTLLDAGFTDALADVPGGTEHSFTGATDRKRIDYVLAGPGVRVTDARIVTTRPGGRLPSDHWPVVADLDVPVEAAIVRVRGESAC